LEAAEGRTFASASIEGLVNWLRRKVWEPLIGLLKQGLSPERLAWSVALGLGLGVFPMLGSTMLLCFLAALFFKLNQPAMQTVNYLAYPLQLLLFIPFIRAGEWLFHAPRLPLSLPIIFHAMKTDLWAAVTFFWTSVWHATVVWCLLAIPTMLLLGRIFTWMFRLVASRVQAQMPQVSA
jgi:uncharacterized protein (DUF2062 family)